MPATSTCGVEPSTGGLLFHVVNLGCKVNRVEADSLAAALLAQGGVVADETAADLIVVNTCTVTAEADRKARKAVRHALNVNAVARVVVTGCAAALQEASFSAMSPRVQVIDRARLVTDLAGAGGAHVLRLGPGFHTRVSLKVQDGCDHACTYCIVHKARGAARSVPLADVLAEARDYLDAGVKELVLAGIDIGAYRDGSAKLPELVRQLLALADSARTAGAPAARVRISSIEPLNVDDQLIDLLATSEGRLCRHLHLPLQSGSGKVLHEMARAYTAQEYAAIVEELRARVPGIALSTDVIVGFPGETDDDFRETCGLVRRAGFMRLHVFPYSRREDTPAAARDDQIAPDVKRRRASELRALGRELARADRAARAGTRELCLVEGSTCLSESYHELPTPSGCLPGSLAEVSFS